MQLAAAKLPVKTKFIVRERAEAQSTEESAA
jgi:ribosomal protein L16/L10AE